MPVQSRVVAAFQRQYGGSPAHIARAPGRVNLIGEHTDYNDGFVMPMAIDRAAWIAFRPRTDQQVKLYSLDYDQEVLIDLANLTHNPKGWDEYVRGIAWALQDAGLALSGWEGVMGGDVPRGAGLSSSAGLELSAARVFAHTASLNWNPAQMALLSQRAENKWVGVNCGIMDQMISAAGAKDHALLIDCRSLETRLVPLPAGTTVVVMDTSTRRGLVDSKYNERRAQCEEAAAFFGVTALRDVSLDTFNSRVAELPELAAKRARHVISENERTLQAAEAMQAGDAVLLGQLMNASHVSMRDDFEITESKNDAMNQIVAIAQAQPGCFGARMTGGGFGGCAVALVETSQVDAFVANVSEAYTQATTLTASVYICQATDGAAIVS